MNVSLKANCPYCNREVEYWIESFTASLPPSVTMCKECGNMFAAAIPEYIEHQCPVSKLEWEE